MREEFAEYFQSTEISSLDNLFDVLNFISPMIDGWSVAEPLSKRKFMQFSSANARHNAYVDFTIPKKSGGVRNITAPIAPLKAIQSAISVFLQCVFEPSFYAFGFIQKRSVMHNAFFHCHQTCVFNADLENFFPSITKKMVRKALYRELSKVISSSEAINYICRVCTVPNADGVEVLPQGAPSSPVLSNIVLKPLDNEMAALASRGGFRYTRYADDMTFSHSKPVWKISSYWQSKIFNIIERYGLKINKVKTKTFVSGNRCEVTGVVVNEKLNVPRAYIKQLRTLLHLWEHYGYEQAQAIYTRDFCHGVKKNLVNVINGKINYLKMIKGKGDSTYWRYKHRFSKLKKQLIMT